NTSYAQVQTVLQRRYDLIPNLVETVRGFASQEERVLTAVTEARARVGGAGTPEERLNAENQLTGALSRLLVVVEQYPELRSNQNFIMLQDQLEGTENRIAVERRQYNETVLTYNSYIRQFPRNIIAGMFGFERKPPFEAPSAAQEAPRVDFGQPGAGQQQTPGQQPGAGQK
ncbi:MAG: LemA family protein, partial [Candidatus Latescibacterota bacterium]